MLGPLGIFISFSIKMNIFKTPIITKRGIAAFFKSFDCKRLNKDSHFIIFKTHPKNMVKNNKRASNNKLIG